MREEMGTMDDMGELLQFFAEGEGEAPGPGGDGGLDPPPPSAEPPFRKGAGADALASPSKGEVPRRGGGVEAGPGGGRGLDPPPPSAEPPFRKGAGAEREAMLRAHFDGLCRQAEALRAVAPDFDLERELSDPEFVRRTAPGRLSVEDAWFSLRHKEIMQRRASELARLAREEAAAAVRSGSVRPRENGSAASAAVSAEPNLRAMSQDERRAYIRRKYPRQM